MPILAVPTTYAGSEMTPIWGLTAGARKTTGRDPRVQPRTVVYDPVLTLSLPPAVAGPSGMNALAHCAEALYADGASPITSLMAERGHPRPGDAGCPRVVAAPDDLDARGDVARRVRTSPAACVRRGRIGIHHKICHVLGGAYDLPHAEMHTVILPHAVAFVAPCCPGGDRSGHRRGARRSGRAGAIFDLAAPVALRPTCRHRDAPRSPATKRHGLIVDAARGYPIPVTVAGDACAPGRRLRGAPAIAPTASSERATHGLAGPAARPPRRRRWHRRRTIMARRSHPGRRRAGARSTPHPPRLPAARRFRWNGAAAAALIAACSPARFAFGRRVGAPRRGQRPRRARRPRQRGRRTGDQDRLRQPEDGPAGRLRRGRRLRPQGIRRGHRRRDRQRRHDLPDRDRAKDSQSNPDRAAEVAGELITDDKVDLMLVESTPETTNPVADVCEANGVPCMSTVAPWQPCFFGRQARAYTARRRAVRLDLPLLLGSRGHHRRLPRHVGPGVETNKIVGALWPNDGDGNAWSSPRSASRRPSSRPATRSSTRVDTRTGTQDFSAQITPSRRPASRSSPVCRSRPTSRPSGSRRPSRISTPRSRRSARRCSSRPRSTPLATSAKGLSTEVWWSPSHPFKSSLTGASAKELADGYTAATTQPVDPADRLRPRPVRGRRGRPDPDDEHRRQGGDPGRDRGHEPRHDRR